MAPAIARRARRIASLTVSGVTALPTHGSRHRRIVRQQLLGSELGPEVRWNLQREPAQIRLELLDGAHADQHAGDGRMGRRELQGRRLERDTVAGAYRLDQARSFQRLWRRRKVVIP